MKTLLLSMLFFSTASLAQGYPSKPIHLIVPLVPGGNQDIMARAVAEGVSKGLGQQIVVENRPGQSAILGTQVVKGAVPDGYTLLSVSVTFARVPTLVKAAGYDPASDFTGVSLICRIPQVLVVNPAVPANNVQELVALAKEKPGQLTFGGSGNGSTGHVAAEIFMQMTGTKLLQVPYKGNAQALVDVMGGQITMMFDQISTSMPHMRSGKVRALAVTTLTRSPLFPDLPTLDESGLKGYDDVTWNGFVAPAGTPREVLARLHAELAKVVNQPDFHKRWLERGIETAASASPQEFSAYILREADAFAKLAREAGIHAD
jgi:tripartite-type tricarboxylate transporter receptor subunit TctC